MAIQSKTKGRGAVALYYSYVVKEENYYAPHIAIINNASRSVRGHQFQDRGGDLIRHFSFSGGRRLAVGSHGLMTKRFIEGKKFHEKNGLDEGSTI